MPSKKIVFFYGKITILQHKVCPYFRCTWGGNFSSKRHYVQSIKMLLCLVSDKINSILGLWSRIHFLIRAFISWIFSLPQSIFLPRNSCNNCRPPWIACDFGPYNVKFIKWWSFKLAYRFMFRFLNWIGIVWTFL